MNLDRDRLYGLLPSIYRIRDAENGYPLRELLDVIAGQVAVLEESLDQLYDNQFVETASPWVLPYLGDLLGIKGLSSGKLSHSPRAEVGHTIAYRRRKGTAAMLEMLARDVTGWPARAVEFFERLAVTQHLNHVRGGNSGFVSLRKASDLELFGSPFEAAVRSPEVRRIKPSPGKGILPGKWNIPNIGIFLWPQRAYSLTRSPLADARFSDTDPLAQRRFRLHPLGMDLKLVTLPVTEDEASHLAVPLNVPMPITCRMLSGPPPAAPPAKQDYYPWPNRFHPSADYYGSGKSLKLEMLRRDASHHLFTTVEPDGILVCDLGDLVENRKITAWGHEAQAAATGKILFDPTRGRVVLPDVCQTDTELVASFHYAFSANIGGGEYDRSRSFTAGDAQTVRIAGAEAGAQPTINAALAALGAQDGAVEIGDSRTYREDFTITCQGRERELRGADQHRPALFPAAAGGGKTIKVTGGPEATVTLNGLLLAGRSIVVEGKLGCLRIRHCTVLPGLKVGADGKVTLDRVPAITVTAPTTRVEIEESIVGPVEVGPDVAVFLRNSIVDAGTEAAAAMGGLAGAKAGIWSLENCTVHGKVQARVLKSASNAIFLGESVQVVRRQEGCVRFCWLPSDASVPRRYHCLGGKGAPRLRPQFTSLGYGDPGYARLGRLCDAGVKTGADDQSEMGAFHDLFQPQREAYLRTRLEEYLRLGLETGVFMAG